MSTPKMESRINTLEFKNLYLDTKNKNGHIRIINSLSGKIESGKLTAVFGNKGVGKTTFLNLLIGLVDKDSKTYGKILYNGNERNPEEWKKLISYIPKDKECYKFATIYEHMSFYMSLGNKKTKAEMDLEIKKILTEFSILDKKYSKISSLSQGDLIKGLIAISVVRNPRVLILDDFLDDLNTSSALNVITILKKFAKEKNCMVIFSLNNINNDVLSYINDFIALVKCGLFYLGPYKKFNTFLVSNEIKNENNLPVTEFLSNILSENKNTPEALKYKEIVENIVEKNINNNNVNIITKICNNYKKLIWECNFNDIKKIMKRQVSIWKRDFPSWHFKFIYSSIFFVGFINIINHVINFTKIPSFSILNELKTCSYKEIFYFSCALSTYLFQTSFNYWSYMSFTGMWNFNSMFEKDYLTGQYSFGTYFITIFCSCFVKNFIWALIYFIFWVFFYKNLMLQPLIFLFVFCFTVIFVVAHTFFFILNEFNPVIPWIFLTISWCVSGPDIDEKGGVLPKRYYAYLLLLNPAYLFVVYLKTKCFGLVDFFKNKPKISQLLKNKSINLEICEISYKDGIKGQIVTEFCGGWSEYALLFNIIFSCICIVVIVIYLFKIFRIPNTRYKLS